MPDYSKGVIYTIRCLNDPNVYVGSTIQSLSVRMGGHRKAYVKNKVLGFNKEIVKDINNWKIELYENYPCNKREELARREGEIIRQIGTLNKNIAGRNAKEYRTDNKENIIKRQKKYNNDKKEDIIKRQKEYFEDYPEYKEEFERINKIRNERIENNKLILNKKKEQVFTNNNLNGVIYTRKQLENICLKNNTKIQSVMYKMRLKLSKIENLLIPEDL